MVGNLNKKEIRDKIRRRKKKKKGIIKVNLTVVYHVAHGIALTLQLRWPRLVTETNNDFQKKTP
jgi:hypothetical protein